MNEFDYIKRLLAKIFGEKVVITPEQSFLGVTVGLPDCGGRLTLSAGTIQDRNFGYLVGLVDNAIGCSAEDELKHKLLAELLHAAGASDENFDKLFAEIEDIAETAVASAFKAREDVDRSIAQDKKIAQELAEEEAKKAAKKAQKDEQSNEKTE